jgi:hypothetical protein
MRATTSGIGDASAQIRTGASILARPIDLAPPARAQALPMSSVLETFDRHARVRAALVEMTNGHPPP